MLTGEEWVKWPEKASPFALWNHLRLLFQHRHDHLIQIAQCPFDEPPLALTTLMDPSGPIYLVVLASGQVAAGYLGDLEIGAPQSRLTLHQFERGVHEILGLVTRRDPLELSWEVLLSVREHRGPAGREPVRLYWMRLWTQPQIQLHAEPAHTPLKVMPLSPESLPDWLRVPGVRGNFSQLDRTHHDLKLRQGRVEALRGFIGRTKTFVALSPQKFLWGTDGDYVVPEHNQKLGVELDLESWVTCGVAGPPETAFLGLTGSGQEQIVKLVWQQELGKIWAHPLEHQAEDLGWTQGRLLLASRNSQLILAREFDANDVSPSAAWEQAGHRFRSRYPQKITDTLKNSQLLPPDAALAAACWAADQLRGDFSEDAQFLSALDNNKFWPHAAAFGEYLRQSWDETRLAGLPGPAIFRSALQPPNHDTYVLSSDDISPAPEKFAPTLSFTWAPAEKLISRLACRLSPEVPDDLALVVGGRRDLWLVRAAADQSNKKRLLENGATLLHLTPLRLANGASVVAYGCQSGQAGLVDTQGNVTRWTSSLGDCWGSVAQSAQADHLPFIWVWSQPGRSFLEYCHIQTHEKHLKITQKQVIEVQDISARVISPLGKIHQHQIALGSPEFAAVWRVDLRTGKKAGEYPLTAPARTLAYDRELRRLLVGTEDGLVWCFDEFGGLLWTFQARHKVRHLDVREAPGWDLGPRYAAVTSPPGLVILDAQGRRFWHTHLSHNPGAVRWLSDQHTPMRHPTQTPKEIQLLATTLGGRVTLYHHTPRPFIPPRSDWSSLEKTSDGIQREQLLEGLAQEPWSDPNLSLLKQLSFRDLFLLLSAVPSDDRPLWVPALWQVLQGKPRNEGDDGKRAATAVYATLIGWAEHPAEVPHFYDRLTRIPPDILLEPWVAVEAARVWAKTKPDGFLKAVELPTPIRDRLHLTAGHGENLFFEALAKSLRTPSSAEFWLPVADSMDAFAPLTEFELSFQRLLRLAATPQPLEYFYRFLDQLPTHPAPGWSPFYRSLRALLVGGLPSPQWTYAQSRSWYTAALRMRIDLPGAPDDWDFQLAYTFQQNLRQQVQQALTRAENSIWPYLQKFTVAAPYQGQIPIELEIGADGGGQTENVQIEVSWNQRVVYKFYRTVFRAQEPPEIVRLEVPLGDLGQLRLRLHNANTDISTERRLELRSPPPSAGLRLPDLWIERALNFITAAKTPHVVVVAEAHLGRDQLVAVLLQAGYQLRKPDAALADKGPGQLYPRGLTLPAIEHALSWDELGNFVLAPVEVTLTRLLSSELVGLWHQLRGRWPHQGKRVWIVNLETALPLQAELGGLCEWYTLDWAQKDPELAETLAPWCAEKKGLGLSDAAELIHAVGADLRVLAAILADTTPLDDARRAAVAHMAEQDLRALGPQLGTALVILAQVTADVPLHDLSEGMVAAEDISSMVKRATNQPQKLAATFEVLDQTTIARLRSARLERDRVRCWGAGPYPLSHPQLPEHWGAIGRDLMALWETLAALGFADNWGSLYRPRALYLQFIRENLVGGQQENFLRRVLGGRNPSDGYRLAHLERWLDAKAPLGPPSPEARAFWAALGKTWSRRVRPALVELARVLTNQEYVLDDTFPEWGVAARPLKPAELAPTLVFVAKTPSLPREVSFQTAVVLGPGVENWANPPCPRLTESNLRGILVNPDPRHGFRSALRALWGLQRFSRYRWSGPLDADSPLFVGREAIIEEVLSGIFTRSYLILGPRRIGKTSLLRKIEARLALNPKIWLARGDVQGIRDSGKVKERLELRTGDAPEVAGATSAHRWLQRWIGAAKNAKKTPVLLLNEIDGLVAENPKEGLLDQLRALADDGLRVVMVGYATVRWAVKDANHPLHHLTHGEKGISFDLGALTEVEALHLALQLEAPPLELTWAPGEKEACLQQLLRLSYHIPWVVQKLCVELIEYLDKQQRSVIRLDDFRWLASQRGGLLSYFDDLDLKGLIKKEEPIYDYGAKATLAVMVYALYFATNLIHESTLEDRNPRYTSFTPTLLRQMLERYVAQICPDPLEQTALRTFFNQFPLDRLCDGLCLTLILAPLPAEASSGDSQYYFQGHIYPLELHRAKVSPLDRFINAIVQILQLLGHPHE